MKCTSACQKAESSLPSETKKHPCYSFEGHKTNARMHIPVAPKCNIACNYCNRRFDCVNESRPGVTSEILTPRAALDKFVQVKEKIPNLTVVGIAGPGDSLADWKKTSDAIRLIREKDPETVICLSTNGLLLPELAEELIALGVGHVTVTVNSIDPAIGAKIYRQVYYQGKTYRGEEGASLLLSNQLEGIKKLTENGVLVKINIVMINGINDMHIPEVVKKVKSLGAFITNIMPLIPAPGSAFANHSQTSQKDLEAMRTRCEADMPQMRHCQQCRADAIGLLQEDRSSEFRRHQTPAKVPVTAKEYKIAVATRNGKMVDTHFGHAEEFAIYCGVLGGFTLLEQRTVDKYCLGVEECDEEKDRRFEIIKTLSDCDAVLSMRIGYHAKKRLQDSGIHSYETCDTIENALTIAAQNLCQA